MKKDNWKQELEEQYEDICEGDFGCSYTADTCNQCDTYKENGPCACPKFLLKRFYNID